jgi:hypothetical protein
VLGEKYSDRITAWNTSPALEGIHYAESPDFVFVTNRPVLAALGLSWGNLDAIQLSSDYLSEYLLYGYSITGQTPFVNVRTIEADQALMSVGGVVSFGDLPSGLDSALPAQHSLEEGAEALAAALEASMERTARQLDGRPLQLRLSGGKDSRLLLGLLRGYNLNVRAITYGVDSDDEVRLAARLAAMGGIDHETSSPPLSSGDDSYQQASRTTFECGGLPPSEPHLVRNVGSAPNQADEAILLGQWPLTKGGMAKVLKYPPGRILATVLKQGAPIVTTDLRLRYDDFLRSWFGSVHAANGLEKLYLFARQFRSGRYLHSHISHYSRDALIAYPISDAEMASVCDHLSMYEKVSEKALFLAQRRIWPDALSIPLQNSVWRFDGPGKDLEVSGSDYELRQPLLNMDVVRDEAGVVPGVRDESHELSSSTINRICRILVVSKNWEYISSMLTLFLRKSILDSTGKSDGWQFDTQASYSSKEFAKFVWRVFAADAWWSRSWPAHAQSN